MHQCYNTPFYLQILLQPSFFVSQLPLSVSTLDERYFNKKLNFCHIQAMIFLQSYVITLGGRLLETGNKRIRRIFGVKSGRGRLRNLPSGRLGENF